MLRLALKNQPTCLKKQPISFLSEKTTQLLFSLKKQPKKKILYFFHLIKSFPKILISQVLKIILLTLLGLGAANWQLLLIYLSEEKKPFILF